MRFRAFHQQPIRSPRALVVAYPWVDRDDYARARKLMIDGDLWPADYEVWRREAERAMESLCWEGAGPAKARLDLDDFLEWCRANDCAADAGARLAYAEMVLFESEDAR